MLRRLAVKSFVFAGSMFMGFLFVTAWETVHP